VFGKLDQADVEAAIEAEGSWQTVTEPTPPRGLRTQAETVNFMNRGG
jgi:hypothetical protein